MRRHRRTGHTPARGRTTSRHIVKDGHPGTHTQAVEKANDKWVAASARVETAELQLENAIRNIDRVLARVDRAHVAHNAQRTVSPMGYTAIQGAGMTPLDTLPRLRSNLARFADHEDVAAGMARLDRAEAQFRAALRAEKKAQEKVELALLAELAAYGELGEQGAMPAGRLGKHPTSRPQRVKPHKTVRQRRRTAERRAG
jgi:hypothetical protein